MVTRVSYGRAASLGLGLGLVVAAAAAPAAGKPAPEKATLRPSGSQQKPVSRATQALAARLAADAPPPPIPAPKASDIRPLYLAPAAAPYLMSFSVLEPGKREDQFWQLDSGPDVVVYLRRLDYKSSSTARMVVYQAGVGTALCNSTNADPFCTIARPRSGVYEFAIANTDRHPGSFSLSLSLAIGAPDKSAVKSNLSRPPVTLTK